MYGIFVNEDGGVPYAKAIVQGYKPIETRNRNMLRTLVGERVCVVRTKRNKRATIVGFVTIASAEFRSAEWLNEHRNETLIPPGSRHDCTGKGKWCYTLTDPREAPIPFPLPKYAIRHGLSFCEL